MLASLRLLTYREKHQTIQLCCLCIAHLLQSLRTALCSPGHQVPSPP